MTEKRSIIKLMPIIFLGLLIFFLNTPQVITPSTYIDYENNEVKEAIDWVNTQSNEDNVKISLTAKYIKDNIQYKQLGDECLTQTAKDVLINKEADCVGTSKLAAAMLTGMNIPVQIVEGCVFKDSSREFQIPKDDSVKGNTYERTGPSEGQLHNWVRAYDGKNWYTIETTAGIVFLSSSEQSYGYNKYGGLVNHEDPLDLCFLQDKDYVKFCATR